MLTDELKPQEEYFSPKMRPGELLPNPNHLLKQANSLFAERRLKKAAAIYIHLLKNYPPKKFVLNRLAEIFVKFGHYKAAERLLKQSLGITPDQPVVVLKLGEISHKLKRFEDALARYNQVIMANADYAEAYNKKGLLLMELGRFDEALANFSQAITVKSDYIPAYNNQGLLLRDLRRFDEALVSHDHAMQLRPDFPPTHFIKAELLLLLGDYEAGWDLYEWRWKTQYRSRRKPPVTNYPLWTGSQPVAGKTVLLHPEVGFGDFIMFIRYVPLLHKLGARVVVYTPPPLVALFATLEGETQIVGEGDPLPPVELQCPIMSLPRAFRTTLASIPVNIPYLRVTASKREIWRDKLGMSGKLRVGIAWSGAANRNIDESPLRNRSTPLEFLKPLLNLPCEFHALQKEIAEADKVFLKTVSNVRTHQDELHDFSDTAALIEEMDLVISIDTSVVHLAGALGKPVWVMLPYASDYRWMLEGAKTPWYPTATLFRQENVGDWQDVVRKVVNELEALRSRSGFDVG